MEKNKVKVSIIVSIYNTEDYLRECIESILHQTFSDIELILINDGSTDGSLQIMEKYADLDDRIVIINQENHGLGYSRNLGIDKSQGEYILFVDSDDYLEKDTVEGLYFDAKSLDLDLLYYSGKIVNDAKDEKYDFFNPYKRHTEFETQVFSGIDYFISEYPDVITSSCMVLIKKDFILSSNIRFRSKYFHEDVAYNFKLLVYAQRISICGEELYCRRVRNDSITRSKYTMNHVLGLSYASYDILRLTFETNIMNELCYCYALSFFNQSVNEYFSLSANSEERDEYCDCVSKLMSLLLEIMRKDAKYDVINSVIPQLKLLTDVDVLLENDIKDLVDIRDDLCEEILRKTQFDDNSKTIGIYGIGKKSKQLLEEYERLIGKLKSTIFFIVTESSEEKTYMDKQIVCIDDIPQKNPDKIVISSRLYGDEMTTEIEKRYGDKYCVEKIFI